MEPYKILVEVCECPGDMGHVLDCLLGKKLKIKYLPKMQEIWNQIGGETCERLIDEIMQATKEHPWK